MNKVEKMNTKNKLSYAEYNERFAGSKKRGKHKRGGKARLQESIED